jgi:oxygen-independent coproporphyrinogen III oxidase
MTTESLPVLPKSGDKDKTEAGNYFVSNYPPFSVWSPDHVSDAVAALEKPPVDGALLGMYTHIPFCRKRCHFCYFKVYTDKNAKDIQRYMDAVLAELDSYKDKPFIGGRLPSYLYFGGGTPSYLSPKQLLYLTDGMKQRLSWDQMQEVAFEGEPGTLNETKLQTLKDIGTTRLSFGVEHFDPNILEINNRAHGQKEIYKAYEAARKVGFDQINVDLIAGMVNETDETWHDAVRRTIELAPECVTIYQMEIPFNTTIYSEMRDRGDVTAPVADWHTKRGWVEYAFEQLEHAGYTVTSAYTAVKDPDKIKFVYRDALWQGADMLSVGVSSFGFLSGTHYQNQANFDQYCETVEAGKSPIFRALTMTDEESLVREFILQLKLGRFEKKYFKDKFDVDVADHFGGVLNEYVKQGLVSLSDDAVELSRDGLLQVDRLLHGFFLPQHRTDRFV